MRKGGKREEERVKKGKEKGGRKEKKQPPHIVWLIEREVYYLQYLFITLLTLVHRDPPALK